MREWVCMEYDVRGRELTRYRLKDLPELPPNVWVWHDPTVEGAVMVVCREVVDDG